MAPRKREKPVSGPSAANDAPGDAPNDAPGDAIGAASVDAPDASAVTVRIKTGPHLRKKDFLDRVIARSGLPRGQARIAVEATLAQLAEVLLAEEEANLPPLGKLKVTRSKDNGRNRVLMVKLVHTVDNGNAAGAVAGLPSGDED